MQRGNMFEVKNHGKAGDARRKIENRGPTACMGVKACTEGNEMQKATTKTRSALENRIQPTVKCWTLDRLASYVGRRCCQCPTRRTGKLQGKPCKFGKQCVLMQRENYGQINHAERSKHKAQKSIASIKMIFKWQRVLDAVITSIQHWKQ